MIINQKKGDDKVNNIQEKRKLIHLTQEQLALKMGVNRSTVAKWESKNILPRNNKIPLLAKVFGCKIDDLFDEEEFAFKKYKEKNNKKGDNF